MSGTNQVLHLREMIRNSDFIILCNGHFMLIHQVVPLMTTQILLKHKASDASMKMLEFLDLNHDKKLSPLENTTWKNSFFNNLTCNKPINNKTQSSRQVWTALLHISGVLHLSRQYFNMKSSLETTYWVLYQSRTESNTKGQASITFLSTHSCIAHF